jgi:hypothetical protein
MVLALEGFRNAAVPHLDNKISMNSSSWGGIANKCPIKGTRIREM